MINHTPVGGDTPMAMQEASLVELPPHLEARLHETTLLAMVVTLWTQAQGIGDIETVLYITGHTIKQDVLCPSSL